MANEPTAIEKFATRWNAHSLAAGNPTCLSRAAVLRSESDEGEAHVAIVFSASAVDAFLLDVLHLAETIVASATQPEIGARLLAANAPALAKGGIVEHLQLVRSVTSGTTFDVSADHWQSVKDLAFLRNELVHHKPTKYERHGQETERYGKAIRHLRRIGALPATQPWESNVHFAPHRVVVGAGVARWAYETAATAVTELVAATPRETMLGQMARLMSGWADDFPWKRTPGPTTDPS